MVVKLTDADRKELADEHWSWIRMMAVQTAIGAAVGAFIGYMFIYYDVHRLGTMINAAEHGAVVTAMIMFSFASLCGMVAMGVAVWTRANRLPEK
ncbi:MAG: hypothetical protein V3V02_01265 [Rhizobiaceae bacterium]